MNVTNAQLAKWVWIIALNLLVVVTAVFVFYQTRLVIGWILIALVLAMALQPAVEYFEEDRGWRRRWALVAVFSGVLACLALFMGLIVPVLMQQGRNFVQSAPELLDRARQSAPIAWLDSHFDLIESTKKQLTSNAGSATQSVFVVVGGVVTGFAGMISIFVLTAFMLIFGGEVFRSALTWIKPKAREHYIELGGRIQNIVGRYVSGSLIIASIGGVVVAITLAILGVPYFLPLGVAMIFLGLVPYMGPLAGAVIIGATTFITAGKTAGIVVLIVFAIYQQTENHLLQPLIQRKTIQMNPLLIVIIMLIGTALSGVLGALLSLPIAAAFQVILQDIKQRRDAS